MNKKEEEDGSKRENYWIEICRLRLLQTASKTIDIYPKVECVLTTDAKIPAHSHRIYGAAVCMRVTRLPKPERMERKKECSSMKMRARCMHFYWIKLQWSCVCMCLFPAFGRYNSGKRINDWQNWRNFHKRKITAVKIHQNRIAQFCADFG